MRAAGGSACPICAMAHVGDRFRWHPVAQVDEGGDGGATATARPPCAPTCEAHASRGTCACQGMRAREPSACTATASACAAQPLRLHAVQCAAETRDHASRMQTCLHPAKPPRTAACVSRSAAATYATAYTTRAACGSVTACAGFRRCRVHGRPSDRLQSRGWKQGVRAAVASAKQIDQSRHAWGAQGARKARSQPPVPRRVPARAAESVEGAGCASTASGQQVRQWLQAPSSSVTSDITIEHASLGAASGHAEREDSREGAQGATSARQACTSSRHLPGRGRAARAREERGARVASGQRAVGVRQPPSAGRPGTGGLPGRAHRPCARASTHTHCGRARCVKGQGGGGQRLGEAV